MRTLKTGSLKIERFIQNFKDNSILCTHYEILKIKS